VLPVIGAHESEAGLAQPRRLFEHRLEHRSEVARGAVNDLQHLGGGGLLSESLFTLSRPLVQLPLRFVPLAFALGKLTLQIGYEAFGIG